ncbi:MAG: zf-HC2 domain-containing protein [Planctomycetota bacterium]|nr:zf-HC2 domain-containing protein [Planctomycetota bacterium]
MSCYSEMTYALLADGELPADETRAAEAHVETCVSCRDLLEGLRAENQILASVIRDPVASPAPFGALRPVHAATALVAAALAGVGHHAGRVVLSEGELPAYLSWLNPVNLGNAFNLMFESIYYYLNEGGAMLYSILTTTSLIAMSLLVAGGILAALRRRPAGVLVPAVLFAVLAFPSSASATETRSGQRVLVAADEIIDDTLVLTGDEIQMSGDVLGDLFVFGRTVKLDGTVRGNLYAFAEDVYSQGVVEGNVHLFVQKAVLEGEQKSVFFLGRLLTLGESGRVSGDLTMMGQNCRIAGEVARDVWAACGNVVLSGKVGRNTKAHAGEIHLLSDARLEGDLIAELPKPDGLHIEPGATIGGKKVISVAEDTVWAGYVVDAILLAGALLVGVLIFAFFPVLYSRPPGSPNSILRTTGIGFLVLIAAPISALILAVTIVGLPLFAIIFVAYLIGIYLSMIIVAAAIGQAILKSDRGQGLRFALGLGLGLLIIRLAVGIPFAGAWIGFLVLLLGLGTLSTRVYTRWRRPADFEPITV